MDLLTPAAAFKSPNDPNALRMVPLGGCGQFGMNVTAFLTAGQLFIVDLGVMFPDPARLGVEAVMPALAPFISAAGGVTAFFLTHGHEDHIGAVPFILRRWPAPVYGTAWTMELVTRKLKRHGLDPGAFDLNVVAPNDRIHAKGLEVEYVHINHSIPMACSLVLRTPTVTVFHSGDFKFEERPVGEPPANFARLASLGAAGVDVLLADSTNADRPGPSPAEELVAPALEAVMRQADGAALVTTFSSNLWRIMSVARATERAGRRLVVTGTGLESTLTTAAHLKLYELPQGLRIDEADAMQLERRQLVILATGCQGEPRSALSRIAAAEHRHLRVIPGDSVIFSSRVIPGNERSVHAICDRFLRAGCRIVTARETPDIHVSGHAHGGDIERLITSLKPKMFLPIHGSFHHLGSNSRAAAKVLGSALKSTELQGTAPNLVIETGDVLDLTSSAIQRLGFVDVDLEYVDQGSSAVMSYETLRERLRIGESGGLVVTGVYHCAKKLWLSEPCFDFIGVGIPEVVDADSWIQQLRYMIQQAVARGAISKMTATARDELVEEVRVLVRRRLFSLLRKKPVVMIKIHLL